MNGMIIGKRYPKNSVSGVWCPCDVLENKELLRDVYEGETHRWPLTANGNDVIGTAHLTNNNTVTFSSPDGARFDAGSKRYLSLSLTFPGVFSFVFDMKADKGSLFGFGICTSTAGNLFTLHCDPTDLVKIGYPANTSGGFEATTPITFNYDDGNYHRYIMMRWPGYSAAWVDGVQIASLTHSLATLTNTFSIGRPGALDAGYLSGYVRNVRMFERALTDYERSRLFTRL
jgi:hypothetical protein